VEICVVVGAVKRYDKKYNEIQRPHRHIIVDTSANANNASQQSLPAQPFSFSSGLDQPAPYSSTGTVDPLIQDPIHRIVPKGLTMTPSSSSYDLIAVPETGLEEGANAAAEAKTEVARASFMMVRI
jgi:hypothetical protein